MLDSDQSAQRRPAIVTVAGYLMILTAVLLFVNAVGLISVAGRIGDAARHAYAAAPDKADNIGAGFHGLLQFGGIIFLIFAAALAVLSRFDLRGANVARILTWVVGGILVLCFDCLGLVALPGRSSGSVSGGAVPGVDEVKASQEIGDAFPGWFVATFVPLVIVGLLGMIAVIVLLALPASGAYFRRDRYMSDEVLVPLPYPAAPPAEPAMSPEPTPPAEPAAPAEPAPPALPVDPTADPKPPSDSQPPG